jgi:hypothetical protein
MRRVRYELFVALVVIIRFAPTLASSARLEASFVDDAFYYAQIARNVAHGRGFTFDGIHATNGFQPLWLGVLVVLFRLVDGDVAPLYAIRALEIGLLTATGVTIHRALRVRVGEAGALVAPLLLVALPNSSMLASGMESSLFLFCLAVTWRAVLSWQLDRSLGLGLACAALAASRLEAALCAPIVLVIEHHALRDRPRAIVPLAGPTALVVATYALASRVVFGVWMPISGIVKAKIWSDTAWRERWTFFVEDGFCVAALIGIVIATLVLARRVERRRVDVSFLAVFVVVLYVVDALVVGPYPWHSIHVLLGIAVVTAALVEARARASVLLLLVILGAIGYRTVRELRRSVPEPPLVEAGGWLRDHAPVDARIGCFNAGTVGYFAHRTVIDLDGLVNDRRFYEIAYEDHDLARYLDEERIDTIAELEPPGDTSLRAILDPWRAGPSAAAYTRVWELPRPQGASPGFAVWRRTP